MFFTLNRLIVALVTCDISFNAYWIIPYDKPVLLKTGLPSPARSDFQGAQKEGTLRHPSRAMLHEKWGQVPGSATLWQERQAHPQASPVGCQV